MYVITFIIGCCFGFMVKIGFDYYHVYLNDMLKSKADMEEVLYRFKKMEEEKEQEKI